MEFTINLSWSPDQPTREKCRHFVNECHTGSPTIPLTPVVTKVSKELLEAHYNLNRGGTFKVTVRLNPDGTFTLVSTKDV